MPDQVKVEDLEVFNLFRAALLKFAQVAEQSITGADSNIARVHSWLENEQATHWQGQLRKRMEAVTKARDELRQKKIFKDASGRTPTAVDEEKNLARCLAAVEHAQAKIEAVKKSIPRLEKASELYRGGVSRLSGSINGEIPKAVALLDRLALMLEGYMQIEAPAGAMPDAAAASPYEESVSRGGDTAAPEPPPPATAGTSPAAPPAPAAESAEPPEKKEGGNVADGQ